MVGQEQARLCTVELGVAEQVKFIDGDAAAYVSEEKASVAACVGATWIDGGAFGTIEFLAGSLRTGGLILSGEPPCRRQRALTAGAAFGPFAIAGASMLLLLSGIYRTWGQSLALIGMQEKV